MTAPSRTRQALQVLMVVPTYNEARNIGVLIREIFSASSEVDVLVVDDGSPDGTAAVVRAMMASSNQVFLLERAGERGLAGAYLAGFKWGLERGYQCLLQMDGDGSHRAADLPRILEASKNVEFVIGSRYCWGGGTAEWPWYRVLMSKAINFYDRTTLGLPFSDVTSGFTAIQRSVFERISFSDFQSVGYSFQAELKLLAFRAGTTFREVPIEFCRRKTGKSKLTFAIILEALTRVFRLGRVEAGDSM